jgi:hypothetical protein
MRNFRIEFALFQGKHVNVAEVVRRQPSFQKAGIRTNSATRASDATQRVFEDRPKVRKADGEIPPRHDRDSVGIG